MNPFPIYPLKFEPFFQQVSRGRRLRNLLSVPLPDEDTAGEAWLLCDRKEHASRVTEGPLKGKTLRQLIREYHEQVLGKAAGRFRRFPLLLKFIDAQAHRSVQVHPAEDEGGGTKAWIILSKGPLNRVYAGLKTGVTYEKMKNSLANQKVTGLLNSFRPAAGDAILIKPGTVHAMDDVVAFEIQGNNDNALNLYDRDPPGAVAGSEKHHDAENNRAVSCINFSQGAIRPVIPVIEHASPHMKERLFDCEHFILWRIQGAKPFLLEGKSLPRMLVCVEGTGKLEYKGSLYTVSRGEVILLPAALGTCSFRPQSKINLFEITLPPQNEKS